MRSWRRSAPTSCPGPADPKLDPRAQGGAYWDDVVVTRRRLRTFAAALLAGAVLAAASPAGARTDLRRESAQEVQLVPTTMTSKLGGWYARRRGVHLYHDGQEVIYATRVRPRPGRGRVQLHVEVRHNGWKEILSKRFRLRRGRARIAIVPMKEGWLFRVSAEFEGNATHAPSQAPWELFRFTS